MTTKAQPPTGTPSPPLVTARRLAREIFQGGVCLRHGDGTTITTKAVAAFGRPLPGGGYGYTFGDEAAAGKLWFKNRHGQHLLHGTLTDLRKGDGWRARIVVFADDADGLLDADVTVTGSRLDGSIGVEVLYTKRDVLEDVDLELWIADILDRGTRDAAEEAEPIRRERRELKEHRQQEAIERDKPEAPAKSAEQTVSV